jgi:hypothetical protein
LGSLPTGIETVKYEKDFTAKNAENAKVEASVCLTADERRWGFET